MFLPKSKRRQTSPVKSCTLRCQQGFVLSLIAIGILVLIAIVTTPLPLMLEEFISKATPSSLIDVKMLNLLEDREAIKYFNRTQCTLDFVNEHKLQQDHPCVVYMIRQYYHNNQGVSAPHNYLNVTIKLRNLTDVVTPPDVAIFCHLLKKKLFLECRALNDRSNFHKLLLDRILKWRGMRIMKELPTFSSSNSLDLPFCLSLKPYPTEVFIDTKYDLTPIKNAQHHSPALINDTNVIKVQCFPLYSLLLAAERTELDYFSLDGAGHDLEILKTLPWHIVGIKTLVVEQDRIQQKETSLSNFMTANGFLNLGYVVQPKTDDRGRLVVFIQDFLKYWRPPNYLGRESY